jgi:hypothetical protein
LKRSLSIDFILKILGMLAILFIAGYLRLFHSHLTPGWYNDEGTVVNIALNVMHGRWEYLGIKDSLLIIGWPPLFPWLLSILFRILPPGINTLRDFTGVLGIISTGLIFVVFQKHNWKMALLMAFSYAVFPKAVLYSRIGFTYNLIVPLVLLSYWAAEKYLETGRKRYAFFMALPVGVSFLSNLVAFTFFPTIILIGLWKHWKDLIVILPALFLPFLTYCLVMMVTAPGPFSFDFNFTFFRVSNNPLALQFILIYISTGFVFQDMIFLFGLTGIFLHPQQNVKLLLLAYLLLPLILITRSVGIGTLGWYYLVPLFPFFAVGAGMLFLRLLTELAGLVRLVIDGLYARFSMPWLQRSKPPLLALTHVYFIFLIFLMPFALGIWISSKQLQEGGFPTTIDFVLLDVQEANQAVQYLNQHVAAEDVVLASPAIAWAIQGNVSDYQLMIAESGVKTIHFPGNIPASRFRFDLKPDHVKYVVVDNIWRSWAEVAIPELSQYREKIEKYPLVYESKNIKIFQLIQ